MEALFLCNTCIKMIYNEKSSLIIIKYKRNKFKKSILNQFKWVKSEGEQVKVKHSNAQKFFLS